VAGITVNQLHNCHSGADEVVTAWLPAIVCTLGTVTVPAAASVYNEFALKKHMDTSVHLQNFYLYFYGTCFNALGVLGLCLFKGQSLGEVFEGQSRVTMVRPAAAPCWRLADACMQPGQPGQPRTRTQNHKLLPALRCSYASRRSPRGSSRSMPRARP
jgi:hypothetical protein